MAKQTTITVTDDLDGSDPADTVYFGLDGREYEIDLSDDHADDLREVLSPYILASRKAGSDNGSHSRKPNKPEPGGRDPISREKAAAIREWVRNEGGHIGDRGRIPKKYVEAYDSNPKDTSIFHKEDDDRPDQQPETDETPELASVGGGAGDPFATFTEPGSY